ITAADAGFATMGASGNNWTSSSVVKWPVLEGAIQAPRVDTCGAYNTRLIKDASDSGFVAFSATNTQQNTLDWAKLRHGVFTHVLVGGMRGEVDLCERRRCAYLISVRSSSQTRLPAARENW